MPRKQTVTRTGNGEGGITHVKRKGKPVQYRAVLTVGWADGKQQRKVGPLRATKAEAREDVRVLREQHKQGINLAARPQTLGELYTAWLTLRVIHKRRNTLKSYRWAGTRIIPALGDTRLDKLSDSQIQLFINSLSQPATLASEPPTDRRKKTKLKRDSIELILAALYACLEYARLGDKLIPFNPAAHIELPPATKSPTKALTLEQARKFLDAARGERLETAIYLMLMLGLRRGETAGLRWSAINVEAGTLTVESQLIYEPGEGLSDDVPKSRAGFRTIKLPAFLVAQLHAQRARLDAERATKGDKWSADQGYVFVGEMKGTPLHPNVLYAAVTRVAERADLGPGYSPHSLRHSCATFLYAQGVPIKTISVYLGHSNTSITLDLYTHMLGGELDDAAERISGLFDDRALAMNAPDAAESGEKQ